VSGSLVLPSPWARQYFPAAERADVERLIPAGHTLTVLARSSPTVWTLVLRKGADEVQRRRVYGRSVLPAACRQALLAWRVAA
jgi:hypothetical protein